MEHSSLVRAVCNILADGRGQVLDGSRSVVSFAIVKNMGGVEILDVEFFGDVTGYFIEIVLDGGFNAIEDLGGRFGGVKGGLTEHTRIDLFVLLGKRIIWEQLHAETHSNHVGTFEVSRLVASEDA